jgi:hypothetical protein
MALLITQTQFAKLFEFCTWNSTQNNADYQTPNRERTCDKPLARIVFAAQRAADERVEFLAGAGIKRWPFDVTPQGSRERRIPSGH